MYLHSLDLDITNLDRTDLGRTAHLAIPDLDRTELGRTNIKRTDIARTEVDRTQVRTFSSAKSWQFCAHHSYLKKQIVLIDHPFLQHLPPKPLLSNNLFYLLQL
jgi:hypothetical protein